MNIIDTRQWALVLAGVSDFYRPPEKLSLTQNLALTATGAIWTRWCFIIKPRNVLYVRFASSSPSETNGPIRLAAVNFFLGCVGVVQVSRIMMWQRSVKDGSASELVEQGAKDALKSAKGGITENPEAPAKSALQ